MPRDLSLETRQAVVAHLRAYAPLTALVPANRIFGEFVGLEPEYPFIRIGYPIVEPYEATCWDGSESDFIIHVFAYGPGTDGASQISKRVVDGMALLEPAIYGMPHNEWLGTQVTGDVVMNVLHAVVRFRLALVVVGA
jgi:hypothetical protein